jgi:hypothetical protein
MPAQQNETLNVVEVELALDIFNEEFIILKVTLLRLFRK